MENLTKEEIRIWTVSLIEGIILMVGMYLFSLVIFSL